MDSSEFTIQYVGGMANVRTCDESLYHRVSSREREQVEEFIRRVEHLEQKIKYLQTYWKEEYHIASKQL